MHGTQQIRNSILRSILRLAKTAPALAFMLGLVAILAPPARTQTLMVLYSFDATYRTNGYVPDGLTIDPEGNLYGTTQQGGQGGECNGSYTGCGTVFNLSRQGLQWAFTSLYKFQGYELHDGALPDSGVVIGPGGSLYGTTSWGGAEFSSLCAGTGCGTVYQLTPPSGGGGSWTETILHLFGNNIPNRDGAWPAVPPIFDRGGNLYGTATRGAVQWPGGNGNVFELVREGEGWRENKVWGSPTNALIFGTDGNLYSGAGGGSCGTVVQLVPSVPSGSGWTENTLYTFQCGNDGGSPIGNLVFDRSGNLYGVTGEFGSGGGGTIFELSPSGSGWTFQLLYSFTPFYTTDPWSALVIDSAGNLYGTRFYGTNGSGNVFKLSRSSGGWLYKSIHDFTAGDDGNNPTSLVLGTDGNLYGTTYSGGAYYGGTVFEIKP